MNAALYTLRPAGKKHLQAPIAEVVRWATAGPSAKQLPMFQEDPPDIGCMRWGLCGTEGAPCRRGHFACNDDRGHSAGAFSVITFYDGDDRV